jgi:hypothetical protein
MAEKALAVEQRCRELAERAAKTAEKVLAAKHCCQESTKRAAATAENALAMEQLHQELAERAAATAENALAMEQRRQESAKLAAATAEKVLAKEQGLSLSEIMALAEYDAKTIASWDAAAVEAVALGVMVLTELKAAPKLRYGGLPPTHFSPLLIAKEVAELNAANLDKQCRHKTAMREKALADQANEQRWAATQEKGLADEAYEQRRAATQEKALADEVNKQCCQVTAARENALADDAFEQCYLESAKRAAALAESALAAEQATVSTDLALPPTAVLPPPHCPTMYKDAVLLTMGGSLCAKSLVVAPLSCPSPTVDGQLQTACRRSQPRCHVGRRHSPWAPNPQEHLLCGQQHRPRAPNQSTVNGWA